MMVANPLMKALPPKKLISRTYFSSCFMCIFIEILKYRILLL